MSCPPPPLATELYNSSFGHHSNSLKLPHSLPPNRWTDMRAQAPERNESGSVVISAHVGWSDGGSVSHLVKGRLTYTVKKVYRFSRPPPGCH
jgi:hypothetical protein